MKIKILSSILVLVLMSCGNSAKQNGTDGTSDTYYSRDTREIDDITGDANSSNKNNTTTENEGATNTQPRDLSLAQETYDKQRNTKMYSSLKMTEKQIEQYESSWSKSMDNWTQDNPNKTLAVQERMKIESDNLKPILDETQFQNYGQWSTSNPYNY